MRHFKYERHHKKISYDSNIFLAAFEGVEGAFAISAGIIAGLTFSNSSHEIILTTAIVSTLVNGFNSASIKYSTEHYLDEMDGKETNHKIRKYLLPSLVHFIAYFIISFVSLIPVILLKNVDNAIIYICLFTILILFIFGFWRASKIGARRFRDGIETALLGTGIILIGALSGLIVHLISK